MCAAALSLRGRGRLWPWASFMPQHRAHPEEPSQTLEETLICFGVRTPWCPAEWPGTTECDKEGHLLARITLALASQPEKSFLALIRLALLVARYWR